MIHAPESVNWLIVRPFGRVGFSVRDGNAFVHCEISDWSKTNALSAQILWVDFLSRMKADGFGRVFSVVPDNDKIMNAFSQRFGFKKLNTVPGFTVYSLELN